MSKSKAQGKLLPFDAARYLTDDAAVAEYMTAILETDDADLLLLTNAGLGRESLYRLGAGRQAALRYGIEGGAGAGGQADGSAGGERGISAGRAG